MTEEIIIALIGGLFSGGTLVKILDYKNNKKGNELRIYKEYDKLKDDKIIALTEAVREQTEEQKRISLEFSKRDKEYKSNFLKLNMTINRVIDAIVEKGCFRPDPCKDPKGRLHINQEQLEKLTEIEQEI